jgi:hypothetical protein
MSASIIKEIQGTWLLRAMNIISSNGTTKNIYGERPFGITMFDAKGYMNAQMGSSTRSFFESDVIDQGTPDEIIPAYKNYMAFFGQYKEFASRTLLIKLEGCLFPNWQGKEIIRYAEITNNTLSLTTPPIVMGLEEIIIKAIWNRA